MTDRRPGVAEAQRLVRQVLHRLGYRFRLRRTDLPGAPDLVLPRWRLAVFVVDCRDYPHADCRHGGRPPPASAMAPAGPLGAAVEALERQGWRVEIVPACAAEDPTQLSYRLDLAAQNRLIASAKPATAQV